MVKPVCIFFSLVSVTKVWTQKSPCNVNSLIVAGGSPNVYRDFLISTLKRHLLLLGLLKLGCARLLKRLLDFVNGHFFEILYMSGVRMPGFSSPPIWYMVPPCLASCAPARA